MDWDRIEGNWKHLKGKIKEKWSRLTDDDIAAIDGRRETLEGKIQQRYGFAEDYVRKEVDDWVRWQPDKPARLTTPGFFLDRRDGSKRTHG
jgi:uncharacterized protein YjbJ (UPF0337 family)